MKKRTSNFTNSIYHLPQRQRRGDGALVGSLSIGIAIIFFASFVATQYLASALNYQPALGDPIFSFISVPIYQPFSWISWVWKWGGLEETAVKHHFMVSYLIIIIGSFTAIFFASYLNYRRTRTQKNNTEHLHGSAHWASKDEIKKTGLLGNTDGVYVGAYQDPHSQTVHYLRHDGPEHIIAFAPTRSGKGVGLVLPTLLSWLHSVLILDIKGENWALTAGWRREKAKNAVLKFEPTATDGSSVCFNPLDEIRLGTDKEVADVQNIVTMIVDPDGKGMNDHWAKTGHALLVGTFLHVLYSEKDKTLAGVANFLSEPSRTLEDTLHYMLNTEHDLERKRGWLDNSGGSTGTHPVVSASARDMLNKSDNERSGVLSTALSFLTLYRDPIIARNTRHSEFKIRDLMNAAQPVSLYLVVPPSDKDRLKPLIRLIINQVMRSLTEKMEFKDGRGVAGYKHRLLLMIDEFPSLGRLEIFQESLAFIAGYGIKAYLITQDIAQLWAEYGKEESIVSNCHIRVAYAPNKIETAEMLSTMTGMSTVVVDAYSYSGRRLTPILSNVSTSIQEHKRPLLTPDEVMRLPGAEKDHKGDVLRSGDMLIFVAGHSPIYGKQILYFADPVFSERAKILAPLVSDRLYAINKGNFKPTKATQASVASIAQSVVIPTSELQVELDKQNQMPIELDSLVVENSLETEQATDNEKINQPPIPGTANAYGMFDDLLPITGSDHKENHHDEQEIL